MLLSKIALGNCVNLDYNGQHPDGDKGRRKSYFFLKKRPVPNGVQPSRRYDLIAKDINRRTVAGRLPQSTISRFACRILVERKPPYKARLYAAGFDSNRKIVLGVSVGGTLFSLRESRSSANRGERILGESNELKDGSLVDLCGTTLLWRSAEGMQNSPSTEAIEKLVDSLNACRPQCPVGLNTLVLPRRGGGTLKDQENQPYVYLNCGHVQGSHEWGVGQNPKERKRPICMKVNTRFYLVDYTSSSS
ncbi:hypothetical protein QYM36_006903 [Artemia franciscana]|uniref:Pellino n=1 Tax=Artemia franciscana TaxID=6661 RepID=A0AA88HSW7_ARTSF|nr:hypothetical protein QYM36_006903 [Artemia franciscana]